MVRLDDLQLFIRAAALGSFSAAAREADLLPGQVSAAIKRLEDSLNIRLFARSTRSLRLTAEGDHYLPFAREALQALAEGQAQFHQQASALTGTLMIAAPSDIGRNLLLPWLLEFGQRHPGLLWRLGVSDQITDVFRHPVDVAIRYGEPEDGSTVALPLAPANRRVVVASPAYLARHGTPRHPDDLRHHACLCYIIKGRVYDQWRLAMTDSNPAATVKVSGPLVSDDADVIRRAAVAGAGIAYKSWLDVAEDVRAGRLVRLLPEYPGLPTPLSLICPHRKQFSPAIRQLHAFLQQRCVQLAEG